MNTSEYELVLYLHNKEQYTIFLLIMKYQLPVISHTADTTAANWASSLLPSICAYTFRPVSDLVSHLGRRRSQRDFSFSPKSVDLGEKTPSEKFPP